MLRRSFFQVIAGGIAAVKSYAGVKVAQARVGSPNGWKITWTDLPSGAGCWTALPQTADRQIAFRSVTSAANDKVSARRRVVAMIGESKNGKNLLPCMNAAVVDHWSRLNPEYRIGMPISGETLNDFQKRAVPEGFKLTTGPTAEDIAAEAERDRRMNCPLVIAIQRGIGECWHGFDYPTQLRCGVTAFNDILCVFDLLDQQPPRLYGTTHVIYDEALEPRQVWVENGNYPFDSKYNRLITVPEWTA